MGSVTQMVSLQNRYVVSVSASSAHASQHLSSLSLFSSPEIANLVHDELEARRASQNLYYKKDMRNEHRFLPFELADQAFLPSHSPHGSALL